MAIPASSPLNIKHKHNIHTIHHFFYKATSPNMGICGSNNRDNYTPSYLHVALSDNNYKACYKQMVDSRTGLADVLALPIFSLFFVPLSFFSLRQLSPPKLVFCHLSSFSFSLFTLPSLSLIIPGVEEGTGDQCETVRNCT